MSKSKSAGKRTTNATEAKPAKAPLPRRGGKVPVGPTIPPVAEGSDGAGTTGVAGTDAPGPNVAPTGAAPEAPPKRGRASRKAAAATPAMPERPARVSALDAAHTVLREAREPMRAVEILCEIEKRGLWKSKGLTPEATLYAAMIREIAKHGTDSRFVKAAKGRFSAAG